MATCSVCSTELQGSWKFCLNCGAPLPTATEEPSEVEVVEADVVEAEAVQPEVLEAEAVQPEVLQAEAIELDLIGPEPTPEPAPLAIPEPIPAAIRPVRTETKTLNLLAVVALALGVIGGPVAIIFGFFAVRQIRQTGERGMLLAKIAIVLGVLWLVIWIVVIAWVVVNGAL